VGHFGAKFGEEASTDVCHILTRSGRNMCLIGRPAANSRPEHRTSNRERSMAVGAEPVSRHDELIAAGRAQTMTILDAGN